jgi:hypothetical protein
MIPARFNALQEHGYLEAGQSFGVEASSVCLDQRLDHCVQIDSADDGEPIKELHANETPHIRLLLSG